MTKQTHTIALFEQAEIRKTWHENQWYFSIGDIVSILTDSSDVSQYIKKMRSRDRELQNNWGTICTPLEGVAKDGKKRKILTANTEGVLRIIQSIPSPKAEPLKQWLARVGYERIQEIDDPELAMKRMRALYEAKGYPSDWIDKRERGIAVRHTLTDEWRDRGIKEGIEYAILTDEIYRATFGMGAKEYKDYKGIKRENLRDHMNDLELIFTMLGEASTTEILQIEDTEGFDDIQIASRKGGTIAGDARKALESETKKKISTPKNHLPKKLS